DPFLLMQLGFQLSYIALLGIVWLHPHISKLWQPENKKLVWVRDVLAMSLAAQLATFPLGLYYFNQFPTYFLLSNLVVIPWSSIALGAGCIFLIISMFPLPEFIIASCGKLIYWLILGLNKAVEFLSALPYSQWEGTYLSVFECLLIYGSIALLVFALIHKHKYLLHAGLAALLLFFAIRSISNFNSLGKNKLTIHAIPKTSLISIKEKDKMYLLGDTVFTQNQDQLKFHINRYAYSLFVPKPYITLPENALYFKSNVFYLQAPVGQFGAHKFLWLDNKDDIAGTVFSNTKFDFIILSKNIKLRLAELKHNIEFDKVILTADNSFYRNAGWEKECAELGIFCINLQKDNSFVINY
ncbi:MAG: ComEC/Rec2 family competence protein, partial [Bacteroidia bacterium]